MTRRDDSRLNRRIYLMNVPYDASLKELEAIIKPHAKNGIDEVVVARDKAGLAKGYAFVFLNDANDVKRVVEYVDGRHLRSR